MSGSTIKANIVFNPTLEVIIKNKWDWRKLSWDFKAAASFRGKIEASLNSHIELSAAYNVKFPEKIIYFKVNQIQLLNH